MQRAPLHLNYYYHFPPIKVFDAWVNPDIIKLWMFKNETNTISATTDLKINGKFSIYEIDGDKEIDHFGKYLKIEKPAYLAYIRSTQTF